LRGGGQTGKDKETEERNRGGGQINRKERRGATLSI